MTKGAPKDVRSTGRKRARAVLFNIRRPFFCVGYEDPDGQHHPCGKTSQEPPKDAPSFFNEIWPEENRVLGYTLQADHENKNLLDDDPANLNWRCASCHKLSDQQTEKGVSTHGEDEMGYNFY